MEGDVVLYNGRIRTLDSAAPLVSAIAARSGRIVYAGDDETARAVFRPSEGPEILDLEGACVLPGLADAHLHFAEYALSRRWVDVERPSLDAAVEAVRERATCALPGAWILGAGWNHNPWGGAFPTAADLDRAAPANPVCLYAKSGHAVWLNSAAMAACGIGASTCDPEDGRLLRDEAGRPSGVLLEGAIDLTEGKVPEASVEEIAEAMAEAIPAAHRLGLTCVHDMDGPRALAAHQILRRRGSPPLRVVKSIPVGRLDEAIALGLRTGLGDDLLRIGHVKMFSDGAMGPRTAWMLSGYDSAHGDMGVCATPTETILRAVLRANAAGLACAIHAIGDRANREILDVLEAARAALSDAAARGRAGGKAPPAAPAAPNRIEHAQILHPDDLLRFARIGVIASMQPIHATSEIEMTERHLGRRAAGAYAFGSLLRSGAVLAFGSDAPVETIDPLAGIHAAVSRRRADGYPGPLGWRPSERLAAEEAVRAYTLGAAAAAGWSDRLGSLSPGKLADMTILDRDVFEVDPMEILGARVVGTMVGGAFVWRAY
jgi:predicted amidohydrolase YtcJ